MGVSDLLEESCRRNKKNGKTLFFSIGRLSSTRVSYNGFQWLDETPTGTEQ